MSDSLEEEVRNSFQAYTSLLKSRAELLSSVSRIMATLPEVRLAFSTGDRATIQDTAERDVVQDFAFERHVPGHRSRGQGDRVARRATLRWRSRSSSTSCSRRPRGFPTVLRILFAERRALPISVTPVYVDSTRGPALLNVLVAGYPGGRAGGAGTEGADRQRVPVPDAGGVITSTLNPRATAAVVESMSACARRPPGQRRRHGIRAVRASR